MTQLSYLYTSNKYSFFYSDYEIDLRRRRLLNSLPDDFICPNANEICCENTTITTTTTNRKFLNCTNSEKMFQII